MPSVASRGLCDKHAQLEKRRVETCKSWCLLHYTSKLRDIEYPCRVRCICTLLAACDG